MSDKGREKEILSPSPPLPKKKEKNSSLIELTEKNSKDEAILDSNENLFLKNKQFTKRRKYLSYYLGVLCRLDFSFELNDVDFVW